MDGIKHEELAQCLFDESNDAFFIFASDENLVLDVNPTAQRLTGYQRKQLLGVALSDLFDTETDHAIYRLASSCAPSKIRGSLVEQLRVSIWGCAWNQVGPEGLHRPDSDFPVRSPPYFVTLVSQHVRQQLQVGQRVVDDEQFLFVIGLIHAMQYI